MSSQFAKGQEMFDNGVKANDGSSRSVLYMCEDMTSEGGGEAYLAWLNAEQPQSSLAPSTFFAANCLLFQWIDHITCVLRAFVLKSVRL